MSISFRISAWHAPGLLNKTGGWRKPPAPPSAEAAVGDLAQLRFYQNPCHLADRPESRLFEPEVRTRCRTADAKSRPALPIIAGGGAENELLKAAHHQREAAASDKSYQVRKVLSKIFDTNSAAFFYCCFVCFDSNKTKLLQGLVGGML